MWVHSEGWEVGKEGWLICLLHVSHQPVTHGSLCAGSDRWLRCSSSAPQLLYTRPTRASHQSLSFVKLAGFPWSFQNHLFLPIFSWLLECCGCFLWAQSWKVVLVSSAFQTKSIYLGEPWVEFACDWSSVPWPASRHNCLNCLWTSIILNKSSYPGYGGGIDYELRI